MYYYVTVILCIVSYIQTISTSNVLIPEILKHEVPRYLAIKDLYKNVVPVNRQMYRAFQSNLQGIQQIKNIILNYTQTHNITSTELAQLSLLRNKLEFSEIFAYRRNEIVKIMVGHFQPYIKLLNQRKVDSTLRDVFHALGIHAITIDEYKQLSFPNYSNETALKAKLLILSCRGTSIWTSSLNASEMTHREQFITQCGHTRRSFSRLVHFPWTFDDGPFNALYFSVVYEHCFNTFAEDLHIPTLEAIFHPESNQKSKMHSLEYLMSNYKLRLVHKQSIKEGINRILQDLVQRKLSLAEAFFKFIYCAHLANDVIFDGYDTDYGVRLRNDIMTAFISHLGYQMRNHPAFPNNKYEYSQLIRDVQLELGIIIIKLALYHNVNGNVQQGGELLDIMNELMIALERQRSQTTTHGINGV